MKKISIIVPVYFNEQSLLPLFERLQDLEQKLLLKKVALELLFVDDGSGDNSLQELHKIKVKRPETKIIKLTRNFGVIQAVKTALKYVTGDCYLSIAADLQDPPELIVDMVDEWLKGSKFVILVRKSRQDPPLKKLFARVYYKLLRMFVDRNYPRGGFDVALMDRTMFTMLQNSSKNMYIPLYAYWTGFQPKVIHYDRQERQFGKSRFTFAKSVKAFLDAILGFSIVPIRLISSIGIFISFISFGYGTFVVINALMGKITTPGFAAIASLISFLSGLIIVMLGVIGEYLWRIFDEVNKRPEAVVEEVFE